MAFALNAEQNQKLEQILSRYPNKMAACIPVLHLCQEQNQNWVSPEVIDFNRPIRISLNGHALPTKGLEPDLSVLLEDVRTRGDRLHPFWARVEQ